MAAGWRRRRQPPARNLRRAGPGRAAHIRTDAGPGQRHAGGNQPTGRRRRRRAQGRPRPARRAGRARPRAPGRLERLAGRDGRRAAPGMAAGRRRRRQPPARNLRCPAAGRAGHLRTRPRPGQRHAGGNQPPGRRRRRGAKAAVALQAELVARDQARLDAWTGTLAEMAATLRQEWQQAGADAASRQQQICEALADTARQISDQSRAHASDTLAEINRLVDAAAEAPPPSPCKATWWPATRPAWMPGPDRWPTWPPRCARNGSRPAPPPPAASRKSATRWPRPRATSPSTPTRQRHHRRDRAPGAGRVRSARRRRGHRRTASEAVRQPGPRQRHAGRARPPARHARDPAGRRQPRIHRATRRRGRAGRHHLGTDGPGGRAVLGTRRIRNRQAGRDLGPGHRQRRRSGQPGRGLRRRGAAVQRVQRQAGHAARTHRGGAGQVHRPGRRTALLLRVAGARSGGPEPDVAKADH